MVTIKQIKGSELKENDVITYWFCPKGGKLLNKKKYTGKYNFNDVYTICYDKYKTIEIVISHDEYYELVIDKERN